MSVSMRQPATDRLPRLKPLIVTAVSDTKTSDLVWFKLNSHFQVVDTELKRKAASMAAEIFLMLCELRAQQGRSL